MKIRTSLTATLLAVATLTASAQKIVPATEPNETQRQLIERGYGMFVHFGMNTFIEQEWSDGKVPATDYAPTNLDCDQWVRVARDAGFRYVLLVTKHHDGFCLWDSKLTDYDVASSPCPIDVVGAVSEACKKYGLKFGIYYSLWDRHEPTYTGKKFKKYVDYMAGQIEELMTNYGEVCEVWFDGAWDKKAEDWDIPRLYNIIKRHNPNCAVGVNGTIGTKDDDGSGYVTVLPDMQIEDNKYYMRYFPGDFRLWDPKIAAKRDHKQYLTHVDNGSYYLPFEHTICLSKEWNWFQKTPVKYVRDLDELEELFYWTTSGGNSLVLNIPPDKTGRIREHEAQTVIALRNRLGIEYGKPLPTGGRYLQVGCPTEATSTWNDSNEFAPSQATDGGLQTRWASNELTPTLTITLNPDEAFNKLTIFEYCDTKQIDNSAKKRMNRIEAYQIDRLTQAGEWETIYISDEPMGDCKTIRFPYPYKASKIRLKVLKARDCPSIYEFNVIADKMCGHCTGASKGGK